MQRYVELISRLNVILPYALQAIPESTSSGRGRAKIVALDEKARRRADRKRAFSPRPFVPVSPDAA